ncbi:6966_t:CDS:10, partial [Paraglomus brasilianum]
KRVYIGGLSKDVIEEDIANRLRPFGSISNVDIIYQQETGESRGFAYVTIKTTSTLWKKCVSTLNGTIWKGMKLRIEDAKPDYKQRLQDQWEQERKLAGSQVSGARMSKKRKQETVTLADNMSLITDKNVDGRKGWKKVRYGRAVAVMRLRKDDGTKFVFNPQHYQNNLKRFTERDWELLKQMPSDTSLSLTCEVDNKHSDGLKSKFMDYNDNMGNPGIFSSQSSSVADGLKQLTLGKDVDKQDQNMKAKQERSNRQRLEAIEKRVNEERKKKRAISDNQTSKLNKHVKFTEEGSRDKLSLFASDDDSNYSDNNSGDNSLFGKIDINPVFEGASGHKRLQLQSQFHGDRRFNLTEDFMSDSDEDTQNAEINRANDKNDINGDEEFDDEISRALSEEKANHMNILKSMFGNGILNRITRKKAPEWKIRRFDPEEPNDDLEIVQDIEDFPTKNLASTPMSVVPKDVRIEIRADLKQLFTSSAVKCIRARETEESPAQIIQTVVTNNPSEAHPYLPSSEALRQSIKRLRRSNLPTPLEDLTIPENLRELF